MAERLTIRVATTISKGPAVTQRQVGPWLLLFAKKRISELLQQPLNPLPASLRTPSKAQGSLP